jgi:hypothetical protein
MTLELNKVTEQIDEMGRVLAVGAAHRRQVLPELRALRKRFSERLERLHSLAESADRAANSAQPTNEPLDAAFPAPEPPGRATILAADGSQIYPDPHSWALHYSINVGSLVYRHGSGQVPLAASAPEVALAVDKEGNLLSREWIDIRRDVAEVQKLADLVESEAGSEPLLALMDSTLGLHLWSGPIPHAEQVAFQKSYEAQVERIRRAGAALAGFLSRSRRAGGVNLLDLAQMAETGETRTGPSPFLGITDQMLWGDLRPGERSALFTEIGEPLVYFFYLNTEPLDGPNLPGVEAEPARIEVPEWVALSPERLNRVHALVYDQCQINNGYPYVLTRADELAIILNEEREALETMLLQAMSRQGMHLPRLSPKERQKRVARAPFRRRL